MDIAQLGVSIRYENIDGADRAVSKFTNSVGAAERAALGMGKTTSAAGAAARAANDAAASSASRAERAFSGMNAEATLLSRTMRVLGPLASTLAAAFSVSAISGAADAWSDMRSQVGAATRDMEGASAMMDRLVQIANASYSPLDQTVESYTRNVAVLQEMGRTAQEAADFTESLNNSLVLTATRGERAASVQNALAKAMALGKLQADGLETVLSNGGAVAEALASELGVTRNALRGMATEGRITSDVIANALIKRTDEFRERAAEMPATIGDAFVRMRTNFVQFVGHLDETTGASGRVAERLLWVADNLSLIGRAAAVAGVALAAAFAPTALALMASGLLAIGTAGVTALNAITAAALRNPFTALATAILVTLSAVWLFRDEIQQAFGIDVVAIMKDAANTTINAFALAYANIQATWSALPAVMGQVVTATVNGVIAGLEFMVNGAIRNINNLVKAANAATSMLPGGSALEIPEVPDADFGRYQNRDGDAGGRLRREMASNAGRIMSRDNFAGWGESGTTLSSANDNAVDAVNRQLAGVSDTADKAGGAMSKAAKEAQRLADAYDGIVQKANQRITDLRNEQAALGMTAEAAARLRYETGFLHEAQNAGVTVTAAQAAELRGLAATMASVEAETARMKESLDFAKGATNGLFSDLRGGLKQGESFWKSFAGAAESAIEPVTADVFTLDFNQEKAA